MTGVHQRTVLEVLKLAGERSKALLDERIKDVRADQIQVDEIWSFVHCKEKNVMKAKKRSAKGIGDQYTFVALDPRSKLVISHVVGRRNAVNADTLMMDTASRVAGRPQITSDGFSAYIDAVEWAFGSNVDFAQLIKLYAHNEAKRERYSPSECIGAVPTIVQGNPDPGMICTSHVERNNLTMRTFLRRLTRLSLGFSKKLENLKHAVALHFAFYNFCRIHKSLRVTPAMEAGIADHVWGVSELFGL